MKHLCHILLWGQLLSNMQRVCIRTTTLPHQWQSCGEQCWNTESPHYKNHITVSYWYWPKCREVCWNTDSTQHNTHTTASCWYWPNCGEVCWNSDSTQYNTHTIDTDRVVENWQSCEVTYLPEASCTLGSAPACSSNLATSAMPERVAGGVTSGLKQATMCSGVSLSRNVAMLGSALLLIRNLAENSSPEEQIVCLYLSTSSCVWQVEQEQGDKKNMLKNKNRNKKLDVRHFHWHQKAEKAEQIWK